MNALLELSVKTRLFAFVLAALLGAWGYYAFQANKAKAQSSEAPVVP